MERRNFGIADDIYAAGLLLAYMCFLPFCEPGSVDGPSLQVTTRPSIVAVGSSQKPYGALIPTRQSCTEPWPWH